MGRGKRSSSILEYTQAEIAGVDAPSWPMALVMRRGRRKVHPPWRVCSGSGDLVDGACPRDRSRVHGSIHSRADLGPWGIYIVDSNTKVV